MRGSLVLVGVGSAAVGGGIGAYVSYRLTEKRIREKYDLIMKLELRKSKEFYTRMAKRAEYSDPTEVVAQVVADRIIKDEEYVTADDEEPEEEATPFDYDREIPTREGKRAYVVSFEEFKELEDKYDIRTLTYYEKDDVLVDERDVPIDDMDGLIGLEALDQFGNGSGDPNVVYVRNDYISMGLEVVRDPDSYEETVLGSLKHSKNYRFRIDDD